MHFLASVCPTQKPFVVTKHDYAYLIYTNEFDNHHSSAIVVRLFVCVCFLKTRV